MAATATLKTRDIQGESLSAATDRLVNQVVLQEGVVDKEGNSFQVLQNLGTDMNVKVGSTVAFDQAVIQGDLAGQGVFIAEHQNATQVLAVAASDPTNDRIDNVILRIFDDTFDSSGFDYSDLEVTTGTPDASPVPPAVPAGSFVLAEILVQNAVTQIVNGDITDKRVEYSLADTLGHQEVSDSTEVASATITTGEATKATVALVIPTTWASWKCEAWASFGIGHPDTSAPTGTTDVKTRIDGTDQQAQVFTRSFDVDGSAGDPIILSGAVGGSRSGMTTTGSRNVELRAVTSTSTVTITDIYLHARAIRTS